MNYGEKISFCKKKAIPKKQIRNRSKSLTLMTLIIMSALLPSACFAQDADGPGAHLHDDLLDHLVGKWKITSIAHGSPFTSDLDVKWVMNHQFLLIHLKSREVVPWWHVKMEYDEYIGYSKVSKRYIVHGMSIEGYDDDPSEGLSYGYRNGNEFKTVSKFGNDSLVVQRFTWEPASATWTARSNWVIGGKEEEVFLDMKLTAKKPGSK